MRVLTDRRLVFKLGTYVTSVINLGFLWFGRSTKTSPVQAASIFPLSATVTCWFTVLLKFVSQLLWLVIWFTTSESMYQSQPETCGESAVNQVQLVLLFREELPFDEIAWSFLQSGFLCPTSPHQSNVSPSFQRVSWRFSFYWRLLLQTLLLRILLRPSSLENL